MPINEANHVRRDRWPLAFDLEGIPRETAERERLLMEHKALESTTPEEIPPMQGTYPVRNHFTVDAPAETIVDINNPPRKSYNPHDPKNEFPKMLYPVNYPLSKAVVADSKEKEAELVKKKFTVKPPKVENAQESA